MNNLKYLLLQFALFINKAWPKLVKLNFSEVYYYIIRTTNHALLAWFKNSICRGILIQRKGEDCFKFVVTFSEFLDFICKNGCRNTFLRSGFNEEVIDVDKKIIYCAISCEIKSSSLSQAPEMHSFQSYN